MSSSLIFILFLVCLFFFCVIVKFSFGVVCGQLPNIVGLSFGVVQMALYAMYRKNKPVQDQKLPEHRGDLINENNNVDQEKQEVVNIEITEKKEENQQQQQQHNQQEQQQQQKQPQNDNVSNNNEKKENKTGEAEACGIEEQRESREVWCSMKREARARACGCGRSYRCLVPA